MFRSYYKIVTFLSFLILIDNATSTETLLEKYSAQKNTLDKYLKHLELIVRFGLKHVDVVDSNFYLGLFIVNVNLGNLMKYKYKNLSAEIIVKLLEIMQNNEILLRAFRKRARKQDKNKINLGVSLMSDVAQWIDRFQTYPAEILRSTYTRTPDDLTHTYGRWSEYEKKIQDFAAETPTPELSEACIAELSLCKPRKTFSPLKSKCEITEVKCFNMLMNGTDFGYALTHRLLLLILAHYGRGCSIFSPVMDLALARSYCDMAFSEAQYIAMHDYQAFDLMLEHISICGMAGFVAPEIHKWMLQIIEFQSPFGCFGQKMKQSFPFKDLSRYDLATKLWALSKKYWEEEIMGGVCNRHNTATAAAAISVALRALLTFENELVKM